MVDIALLGTGGMMPLPNRFLTSMLCRIDGSMLLVDCGEGTQVTLKQLGWGFKNIDMICFTHYHADHISGLPGLLLAIGNSARTEPLTLVGPPGLRSVVNGLTVITPALPFELVLCEYPFKIRETIEIAEQPAVSAEYRLFALGADHGIPCFSYSVELRRKGKFDLVRAEKLNLPRQFWKELQNGESVSYNGETFTPSMVMGNERRGIKVTYSTDTRPIGAISKFAENSDLFICEGLYGDNDNDEKAAAYRHMTFREAATLAKNANADELWLTHYSPSLTNPPAFLQNATSIFPNTLTGKDRMTKTIVFREE